MNASLPNHRRADALALLAAMLFPSLLTWAYFIALRDQPCGVQQTVYTLGKCLQFGFPAVWVWLAAKGSGPCFRTERRREDDLLRPKNGPDPGPRWTTAGLGEGLVVGLAMAALIVGGYFCGLVSTGWLGSTGALVFEKVRRFGVGSPAGFVTMGVFYSLIHSLLEEYYWRWFVYRQTRLFLPRSTAVVVASAAFAAHHAIVLTSYLGGCSPLAWVFTAAVGVGGAVWCWLYDRSRSLGGPWLSHALADAAIFYVAYCLVQTAPGWPGR